MCRSHRRIDLSGSAPAARVFRTGEPLHSDALGPDVFAEGTAPGSTALAGSLHPGTGLLLPMVTRGRVAGVLSVVVGPSRRSNLTGDVKLYAELARRAGTALDNARLYGERTRVATRLQEALLPAVLPDIAGVRLAAHYSTAEEAVEVGGDFYDVFGGGGPDEWFLVIGDVSGRGVDAAGATGLARQTLRAVAQQLGPAAALARLNERGHAAVPRHDLRRPRQRHRHPVGHPRAGRGRRRRVARAEHRARRPDLRDRPQPAQHRHRGGTRILRIHRPAFSPDGRVLFINIQTPGLTLAITGPWEKYLTR